jgi:hypothetical protein
MLNLLARFIEPITAKVRFRPYAARKILEKGANVGVAEFAAQEFPSKKRRIADDYFAFRPFAFSIKL